MCACACACVCVCVRARTHVHACKIETSALARESCTGMADARVCTRMNIQLTMYAHCVKTVITLALSLPLQTDTHTHDSVQYT